MKHNSWFARADSSPALESRMMRLDRQGWQGDLMRAVAFQSPVDSQPPGALDQLFYSDRLLTAKEVARVLSNQRKEGLQLRIEGSDALLQDSILGPFSGEGSEPLVEPARIRAPKRTHSIIKALNLFLPLRQVSICV